MGPGNANVDRDALRDPGGARDPRGAANIAPDVIEVQREMTAEQVTQFVLLR